ncbi:MAG TPA: GlsB/YeaQ/YmgE family stress response membrane protein [Xanthobacteraceae bacterium]|nr:GlsB/YeaQ/YmgE family stress response membrane protein [Xanthobacteraceae bacterium]
MRLTGEGLLIILLVGLIAGWLAGQLVTSGGFGLVGDIAIGIVGALIGTWSLTKLGIHIGGGLLSAVVVATVGAVLLLLAVGLVRRRIPRRSFWRLGGRHWRL